MRGFNHLSVGVCAGLAQDLRRICVGGSALRREYAELFELNRDLLLYVATCSYFEGKMQACPIAAPRNWRCTTSSPRGAGLQKKQAALDAAA